MKVAPFDTRGADREYFIHKDPGRRPPISLSWGGPHSMAFTDQIHVTYCHPLPCIQQKPLSTLIGSHPFSQRTFLLKHDRFFSYNIQWSYCITYILKFTSLTNKLIKLVNIYRLSVVLGLFDILKSPNPIFII